MVYRFPKNARPPPLGKKPRRESEKRVRNRERKKKVATATVADQYFESSHKTMLSLLLNPH